MLNLVTLTLFLQNLFLKKNLKILALQLETQAFFIFRAQKQSEGKCYKIV